MSDRPTGKEIRTLQNNRVFVQFGQALPNVDTKYYGQDMNYAILQNAQRPVNGTVTPHWTGDPRVTGKYRLVARTIAAPALPSFSLNLLEKKGTINRLFEQDCGFTAYVASGDCADISDFLYGWSDKVEVYAGGIVQVVNGGNRGDWATDNPIINQAPATAREIYEVGKMGFGEIGAADIAVEVLDIAYGNTARCAGCGQPNDGAEWIYFIQKYTGSNDASVVYSTDGGATTNVIDITGIGATTNATFIDVVGNLLVVGVTTENAYYYATINSATGVPGTFTKVTTGFVTAKTPTDILVYSPREVFFSANGGYVYKSSDITAGVSALSAGGVTSNNLSRIAGAGDTIVAVGATGTVIVSVNRGQSFALTAAAPSANTLQGVDVRDSSRYWVCDSGGGLFYTLDGGETWTAKVLTGSPTNLCDVVFVNDEVGWVTGATTDPYGLLYATWNGGRDWTTTGAEPRMIGVPVASATFQRGNRVAVPTAGNTQSAVNNVLVAGLGATTDGIVLQGTGVFF